MNQQFLTLREVIERTSESHTNLIRSMTALQQEQRKLMLTIAHLQYHHSTNIADNEVPQNSIGSSNILLAELVNKSLQDCPVQIQKKNAHHSDGDGDDVGATITNGTEESYRPAHTTSMKQRIMTVTSPVQFPLYSKL
jgi:hypothetical protein